MAHEKDRLKECCSKEHERVKEDVAYCDSHSRTEEQKHHCYKFAAWQSGRRAKRCADENATESGLLR